MARSSTDILHAKSEHLAAIEGLWRTIAAEHTSTDEMVLSRVVDGLRSSLHGFNLLESASFWLLLARKDGIPAGYLTTVRIPKADHRKGVLYIDELYVLQGYRRCGIGSSLLREVYRLGQELGFWRIRLNADQNDAGVCSFYEANGFSHGGDGFFQRPITNDPG